VSNGLLLRITYFSVLFLILSLIATPLSISNAIFMTALAQQPANTENATAPSTQQNNSLTEPGEMDQGALRDLATAIREPSSALKIKMAQLSTSNKTEDIATLAYIWGYPLISMERSFNWFTNPNSPTGPGHGPANHLNCNRETINANDTDVVLPNADTLYCVSWLDLSKEPVVLTVPPIPDRYYTFEFLDAYTNVFDYVGTRATGSDGGTYLIAGPEWHGDLPKGMIKIWSPTDLAWILQRTLLKGQDDINNVRAIQDQMSVTPLSAFQGTNATAATTAHQAATNTSETPMSSGHQFVPAEHVQNPVSPKPPFIPATGIRIFDEIGTAMSGNSLNPPEPALVDKFASIGVGIGKTPSTQANDTTKAAMQAAITEGEKLIAKQVPNLGTQINGWRVTSAGLYGTDYLFRAAVTKLGLGANIGQEAIYPPAFTDSEGRPLTGNNSYVIHFNPGQQPPVDGFWSISMYNNASYFVDNPINRYQVSPYTGLKNNTDGSLDIYIQNKSPGPEKESNWLPAPPDEFKMTLRLYLPQTPILNGTWPLPLIERTAG
jgi:DNA sulfur modification protein DndE